MILDTSALIAILYGEPEGPSFIDLIEAADVWLPSLMQR